MLYKMEKTDDTSMVVVIKDIILRLCLDGEKLRGECYNGWSTMMGKKKGAATQIKKDVHPFALSTYCYAHYPNLACHNWIRNSTIVSKSLDRSYQITKLVKFFS